MPPRVAYTPQAPVLLSDTLRENVLLGREVSGLEHLDAAIEAGPTLVLCNHLSYFDTQATDAALDRVGRPDLAGEPALG